MDKLIQTPEEILNKDHIQVIKPAMEYKLFGHMSLTRGLKLYAYNFKTKETFEVKLNRERIVDFKKVEKKQQKTQKKVRDRDTTTHIRVDYDPDCMYVEALNLEVAKKKIVKRIMKYYLKYKFL